MATVFPTFEDHDQRFKVLIREFFADFLRLFFADWAARFDLDSVEWLDTELLPNPPDGSRHRVDLVAQLRTREAVQPDHWIALIHVEIESPDRTTALKPRLPSYYLHLRERYGLPVLPVVLYLQVGLDGIGIDTVVEKFWELDALTLKYLYVGLPALDGEAYLRGDNWIGVALSSLMKLPKDRIADLGLLAFQRLQTAGLNEQQTFLLTDCFDSYLDIGEDQMKQISATMDVGKIPGEKIMFPKRTVLSFLKESAREEGLQEGRHEGRHEGRELGLASGLRMGRLEVLEAILETKFGSLSSSALEKLRQLPDEALHALPVAVAKAGSLSELGLENP